MKRSSVLPACLLTLFASSPLAQSSEIEWTTDVTEITSVDDIDLTGTLAHAGSWGSVGALDVVVGAETITFDDVDNGNATATQAGENANAGYFVQPAGFAADFLPVMDSFAYDGDAPKVVVLSGLTSGNIYQVQLFASDDRAGSSSRTQLWSDNPTIGSGNETSTFAHGDSPFVIGQFIADHLRPRGRPGPERDQCLCPARSRIGGGQRQRWGPGRARRRTRQPEQRQRRRRPRQLRRDRFPRHRPARSRL